MLEILPIPAFKDNYIWLLQRERHAIVVDPGDAAPVMHQIDRAGWRLDAILVTHHHQDHTGGVAELAARYDAAVYAPRTGSYPFTHVAVVEGDRLPFPSLGLTLGVMETPGHTLDHVAYHDDTLLFCGDTLFGCGCGRLFEGTAEQLFASLQRLARLPETTRVYCAHEYTEHNIDFARTLDPHNQALQLRWQQTRQLRQQGRPTLPSSIGLERATNPFLRCHTAALRQAAGADDETAEVEVFSRIRAMRNHY